jgi:hypothetical protein
MATERPAAPAHENISMSLRPSPTAITRSDGRSSQPRTRSRAVALLTPSGAMSSHAVQPIA